MCLSNPDEDLDMIEYAKLWGFRRKSTIMKTFPTTTLLASVVELLTEAYEGPPDPSSTWFIDNEPNSGILGLLEGVTAREASTSVDGSGEKGTTIAGHTEHLRWSLAALNSAIRGGPFGDWAESWSLQDAQETGWNQLRNDLQSEFETLRQALKNQTELEEEYLSGFLALVPHAAYHLGNIRQMIERVRQTPDG
jgi:hypothetical protein